MPGSRPCEPGCGCGNHNRPRMSAGESQRRYREQNREKVREQARESARRSRAADPERHAETHLRYRDRNREKINARQRERFRSTYVPGSQWADSLWFRHRMRPEGWQQMWADQDGRCCYCERPLPEDRAQVHVDHDHACTCGPDKSCSACRRGLACKSCNALIGHAADDPDRLERIAANLRVLNAEARGRIENKPIQEELLLDIKRAARRREESA